MFHPSFVLMIVDFMTPVLITPGVLGKRRSACIDGRHICSAGSVSSFRWELSVVKLEFLTKEYTVHAFRYENEAGTSYVKRSELVS